MNRAPLESGKWCIWDTHVTSVHRDKESLLSMLCFCCQLSKPWPQVCLMTLPVQRDLFELGWKASNDRQSQYMYPIHGC